MVNSNESNNQSLYTQFYTFEPNFKDYFERVNKLLNGDSTNI